MAALLACSEDERVPSGIEMLPAGWNEIRPEGETLCGNGEPYAFFVRKGSVNRLVIELQGGGGCWDERSCFETPNTVRFLRREPDLVDEASETGIHDADNPLNPVAGWHHVIVSYCTADLHWGNIDRTYGNRVVHHRGGINVRAVLDWVEANVPDPERILVTGHSGGSYGSILWAPHVARHYGGRRVVQLGDGGTGVIAGTMFLTVAFPAWNAEPSFPSFIEGADITEADELADLYRLASRGFPEMRLGEVTTIYDWDQVSRYQQVGGGDARQFAELLRANVSTLEDELPQFTSYLSPGSMHVITNRPETYTMRVDDVLFTDWLAAHVGEGALPESVSCGDDCLGPMQGDLGAPEEWACLAGAAVRPSLAQPTAGVAVHLIATLRSLDPAHDLEPYAGLHVKACARDDTPCAHPLDEADVSSIGEAILTVPTDGDGFDGFFFVTGADAAPTRLYFWPPIADAGLWPATGQPLVIDSTKSMQRFAALTGEAADPERGQVRVSMLDCAGSYTARADSDLDGAPPTTYVAAPPQLVSDEQAITSAYVNVEPGLHTVHHVPDSTGEVAAALEVFVEAGTVTEVWGFGPRP